MRKFTIATAIFCLLSAPVLASSQRTLKLEILPKDEVRETLEITYQAGSGIERSSLDAVNHFLRNRRTGEVGNIDPKLLDLLWNISADVKAQGRHITIIRGLSNPKKIRKDGAVFRATKSQHTKGQAIDFKIDGVPVTKLRDAAIALKAGGVGYYRDAFIHIDTGKVRHWPRKKN